MSGVFDLLSDNISVGVDIESICRFEKYSKDRKKADALKIYTQKELDYCYASKMPAKHLAARFCAKEAIYKALCGLSVGRMALREIEIVHNENQVPQVNFLSKKCEDIICKLSLSHCKDKAVAYVLLILVQ